MKRRRCNLCEIAVTFPGEIDLLRTFSELARNIVFALWPNNEQLAFEVELCLTEALSNVVFHGHKQNPAQSICFEMSINDEILEMRVYDQGPGFDFAKYQISEPEQFCEHGRGLLLIQNLMDEVEYFQKGNKNVLRMRKKLPLSKGTGQN
ncbi:hypothetical protein DRQ15_08400 [candidate division KSB1 bacterium]|nr:ATP-binding protein [bacterium]OQX57962.1 MAG: hypothetical protein B5M50_05100 [candidate division KSB1 bacterium 4484_219]RKY76823.1 MAG: hypothetical protein DRQ00_08040 [candidate division KSB1 bacterium]RKY88637.1 MAG: hypothetical protein DRQ11_03225 [candidate division KSB1 bacterium]RKY90034.1 MAG: hypothetical protein DRQ15_08400 [candidate division KSB1 bacterium]